MRDEEGNVTGEKKSSKHRKIMAIVIVIILIQVSFIAIWYVYFRPWTIRDVARAANIDFDVRLDNDYFLDFPENHVNLGFSHDLAGQQKMVRGHITDISTYLTPIGPLTYYELDDFEFIRLVEWDMPRYKIGSELEKKVSFEWSGWNEDRNVYSPQLDFPALIGGISIERTISDFSLDDMILVANQTVPNSVITISVTLPRREGFPLALFNCTLRRGRFSGGSDSSDARGGYRRNPIIDSISSLTNVSGANNIIHFSDANQNGLLDDGDYFTFNVTRPKEDSALLTYMFSVNDFINGYRNGVLWGGCYIIMTNRGVIRHLSWFPDEYGKPPYFITQVISEEETETGVTARIIITRMINEARLLIDSFCILERGVVNLMWIELLDGVIHNRDGLRIEFSDVNINGLLDMGDIFVISGLNNRTEYEFFTRWEETEDGFIVRGGVCSCLLWTTGIGTNTGYIPVIQFGGRYITNTTQNRTVIIDIERMYGVPGVNLSQEEPYIWFRIHLERDGQEVILPVNLTQDFKVNRDGVNFTFLDADANEYINTGDSFIFEGFPGLYRLILDYVQWDREEEEGFRLLHSQSYSWTI